MSITGTVKVLVVVAPNGNLKSTKAVGGHPLLVNAAMDAIKKWKSEQAPEESTGIVEFKFQPQDEEQHLAQRSGRKRRVAEEQQMTIGRKLYSSFGAVMVTVL